MYWIIIILLLILIIYFISRKNKEKLSNKIRKKYDISFKKPKDVYEKTIGYENDDTVKIAVNKALNESDTLEDSIVNDFIIAELYRFNIQDKHIANKFYKKTLNQIIDNPDVETDLPTDFIIDRIEDYNHDPIIPYVKKEIRNRRKKTINFQFNNQAKNQIENQEIKDYLTGSKIKEQKKYFTETKIVNDPQNVHDSNVNNELYMIYDSLKNKNIKDINNIKNNITNIELINDIKNSLNSSNLDENKKERANIILDKFNENNTIDNLKSTDIQILKDVWKRIHSNENKDKSSNLKESLFDSLADSMEKSFYSDEYKPVCISGRCSRILQSLTLLDNDEKISTPVKTTSILKDEIMTKSYKILQDELSKQPENIQKTYNSGEGSDEDMKNTQKFEESVKEKIINIEKDYPDNIKVKDIINDALAGI